MKKLSLALFGLASTFLLSACSSTISASSNKKTLEGAGYSVTLKSADEYKSSEGGKDFDGLENYISAVKMSGEEVKGAFMGWYFSSISKADDFTTKYAAEILASYATALNSKYDIGAKIGQHNNVCFVATQDAIDACNLKA